MIFIDKMKNLKIYKTPMFLPTLVDDKKKHSAVLLMTPNYNSSKRLMNSPLFVNRMRYLSYYLKRDVSFYINANKGEPIEESYILLEDAMSAEDRNKLDDSQFGLPKQRKYPLDTEARVRSAIKFFNYCDPKDEKELVTNIIKAIKKFKMEVHPPKNSNNRFWKYYQEAIQESINSLPVNCNCGGAIKIRHTFCKDVYMCENCNKLYGTISTLNDIEPVSESVRKNDKGEEVPEICPCCGAKVGIFMKGEPVFLCTNKDCNKYFGVVPFNESDEVDIKRIQNLINENTCINTGDKLIFFNEDSVDSQLYRMLYPSRLKTRKDIIALYEQVKKENPFIKYTFPDINKYNNKNIFVDLYYYTKIFFENNTWVLNKGMNLFLRFMTRLIHNPDLKSYTKKTIFIPISDWCKTPVIWNFRQSLNPMSLIYYMMYNGMEKQLVSLFENSDIVFVGTNKYFKINFGDMDIKDFKSSALKFKIFLVKMVNNEEFDESDVDSTFDSNNSSDVIKANIIDKIEQSKGVDITPQVAKADSLMKLVKKETEKDYRAYGDHSLTSQKPEIRKEIEKINTPENKSNISKATLTQAKTVTQKNKETNLKMLATAVAKAADNANSEEDAWDNLDNDDVKQIIVDLDSDSDDKPNISAGRASRMSDLDRELMDKEVKGKSIKEILEEEKKETPKLDTKVSSPNEEWKSLGFVNFDKNYNLDRDIIRCFRHFKDVSRPIVIRNLEVTDNSTSEDRVSLYTAEMEDYRGKRFTIKLDIPVMEDNKFLLRGNSKTIQTQFFNMPIIKTDSDTCQIISNYMKIFVRKFGSGTGKSLPMVSRFIKAISKYTGRKIKFEVGNNSKVCNKYELPIDYIDLASVLNKIETDEFIIYFNQDEVRNLYTIEEGLGVPYLYDKKSKWILYYKPTFTEGETFTDTLINHMIRMVFDRDEYKDFMDLVYGGSSPKVGSYSRCSIMNSQIPLIVICAYHEGLRSTLSKAKVNYTITSTLSKEVRHDSNWDWIKFNDGYLSYLVNYESSLLLNGLKACPTEDFSITEIDSRNMYLEFLDNFGGRIKADGLENFYDLMVDPLTRDSLEFYHFPTDYVSILLYSNALLADNKFIKHTDTSSRRFRRYILIAVYTYKVLSDAYAMYANQLKHSRDNAEFFIKQSAVIDKFLTDSITSDDSCINALRDVEAVNSVTTKGPSGMNSDRAYSLDKRTYDESMLNILGMSTGFAANVGITRQATIDSNVDENGYVISINGNTDKMNSAKSLTATEALTPFGTTHDDPIRTAMTFIQTAKHAVRTEESDPLLVTNGADEAMVYMTSNKFAYKAKKDGTIKEYTEDYIIIEYEDGSKDYINLKETIEKNSDGGYYVPLKLDAKDGLRIGMKVKANEVIAYDKYSFSNSIGESDNLAYNVGKLAKVAIINTDEGFEDSGVITEKMADKLATRVDLMYDATLDKETEILYMAKVGDKIECGDPLMIWQAPFDDEDARALMKSLTGEDVSELGKKKLKSEVTGVVTNLKILRTIEYEDMSESMRNIVEKYETPLIQLENKLKEEGITNYTVPAHTCLPPTGKLKKAQNAIIVEYHVEYKDTVGVGDKVVYFAANKAVEKNVIPRGKEPYTEFRPNETIDAFVSEVSIDKRMVTSTIIYGSLQKLMIELDRSVKDIMGIPYDDSTV